MSPRKPTQESKTIVRRNWKQIKGEECQRAWAVWLKEEPSTSKRPRTRGLHSCCPVHGCNARSKHPKHHVWDCHIPQVSGITHVGVRMVSRLPPPPCLVSANHGEMAVRPCRYFGSSCGACGFNYFPAQGLPHHRQLQEADIGPCLHDEVAKDPWRYFAFSEWASSTYSLENPCCLVAGMSSKMRTEFLSLIKEDLNRL